MFNELQSFEFEIPERKGCKKGKRLLIKGYLFVYNFIQVIGWSYILYLILNFYIYQKHGELWLNVKTMVVIFQNAAALEILHAAVGLVPSNVLITTCQVLSRLMVVDGILLATPTGSSSPGLPLCLTAWTITEIIRNSYYVLHIIKKVPYILKWCRYTFFIALYPIGVSGELLCLYWALEYIKEEKLFSYELPNTLNFIFSYYYFLLFIMSIYIPVFVHLYLHMFDQRRNIIGRETKEVKHILKAVSSIF